MNVGHLFVLFGLNVQSSTFRHGLHLLASVHMAASAALHGIASLGHGLISLTENLSEEATHIHSLSQAMGMTIEQAQRWGYVAEQSGSNLKELSVGVSMLQGNLRKLAIGDASPRLLASFRALRTSAADAKEAMKGPEGLETVMLKMADRFKELGVSGEASTLARLSLGARAGRALQADMIRGSEQLKIMFARLDAIGGTIAGKDVITLQNIFDLTLDIKKAWHGLASTIIAALSPVISKLLNDMALWFGQNKELISDVMGVLVHHLIAAFRVLIALVDLLGRFLRGLIHGDAGAVIFFSIMSAGILMIASLIVTALLPTITLIGGALYAAMLPLLPYTILLAAIIALSILIYKNWKVYGEFFSLLWKGIAEDARIFWDWLSDKAEAFSQGFNRAIDAIADAWSEMWDDAEDLARKVLDVIVSGVLIAVNKIVEGLNYLPGVDIGKVEMPEWARYAGRTARTVSTEAPSTAGEFAPTAHTANAPAVSLGAAFAGPAAVPRNVNVAPTTVNIYGVKDAKEASGHIADTIDAQNRHAAAALGGEI